MKLKLTHFIQRQRLLTKTNNNILHFFVLLYRNTSKKYTH